MNAVALLGTLLIAASLVAAIAAFEELVRHHFKQRRLAQEREEFERANGPLLRERR